MAYVTNILYYYDRKQGAARFKINDTMLISDAENDSESIGNFFRFFWSHGEEIQGVTLLPYKAWELPYIGGGVV